MANVARIGHGGRLAIDAELGVRPPESRATSLARKNHRVQQSAQHVTSVAGAPLLRDCRSGIGLLTVAYLGFWLGACGRPA